MIVLPIIFCFISFEVIKFVPQNYCVLKRYEMTCVKNLL